jgi:hypothetical protein
VHLRRPVPGLGAPILPRQVIWGRLFVRGARRVGGRACAASGPLDRPPSKPLPHTPTPPFPLTQVLLQGRSVREGQALPCARRQLLPLDAGPLENRHHRLVDGPFREPGGGAHRAVPRPRCHRHQCQLNPGGVGVGLSRSVRRSPPASRHRGVRKPCSELPRPTRPPVSPTHPNGGRALLDPRATPRASTTAGRAQPSITPSRSWALSAAPR